MKKRVLLFNDPEPMDPREWGSIGTMYCWHRRYNLGDSHNYDSETLMRELACEASDIEEQLERIEYEADQVWSAARPAYDSWDSCNESINGKAGKLVDSLIETALEGHVILPLALYDHSGISMSTGKGSCPWDSGQVGWIVCDKETIDREFSGNREAAEKHLEIEVEIYNQYLTGDVYGFHVEERCPDGCDECSQCEDWNEIDSCYGFFGRDPSTNGMADHLEPELLELACKAEVQYWNQ